MTEFEGKTTDQLSDLYGSWLEANGFEGDEPADELLMFCEGLDHTQRQWLEAFCEAWDKQQEIEDEERRNA